MGEVLLRLTKASTDDKAQLNALLAASKGHWGYDEAFMAKFMTLFGIKDADLLESETYFAALPGGESAVGFFTLSYGPEAELVNFFLDPSYIGQGLGRLLFKAVVGQFKRQEVEAFKIWSDPHANAFYARMGAVLVGEKLSPMGPGRITHIYEYRL